MFSAKHDSRCSPHPCKAPRVERVLCASRSSLSRVLWLHFSLCRILRTAFAEYEAKEARRPLPSHPFSLQARKKPPDENASTHNTDKTSVKWLVPVCGTPTARG